MKGRSGLTGRRKGEERGDEGKLRRQEEGRRLAHY